MSGKNAKGAARHIAVNVVRHGDAFIVTRDTDCSVQLRGRILMEETPAPGLPDDVRAALHKAAVEIGAAPDFAAGSVEFLYSASTGEIEFLKAAPCADVDGVSNGCFIRAHVYAAVMSPETGVAHQPLTTLAVEAKDRSAALRQLRSALAEYRIDGVETNLDFLREIARHPHLALGEVTTGFLPRFAHKRRVVKVLAPGTQTTVQDHPGRLGYWHTGVPPSGPMDALAFRLANRLVGNASTAPGLEITVHGPELIFESEAVIALTGADFGATLNGARLQPWRSVRVPAGAVLKMGHARQPGYRAYLSVAGGFEVPEYLGSRSTFILGKFGGHEGRMLRAGDALRFSEARAAPRELARELVPRLESEWEIGVLYGPHGAPDFFTRDDVQSFFSTAWKVHHNSDRTGVRLIGPKPVWARPDGGEAGLHPSNIHDNAYAIGAIDFTGDMPVILGPDGPSLGGFVCLATIAHAELWKMGQLRPGDLVRFRPLTYDEAVALDHQLDRCIETLSGALPSYPPRRERNRCSTRRPACYAAPAAIATSSSSTGPTSSI